MDEAEVAHAADTAAERERAGSQTLDDTLPGQWVRRARTKTGVALTMWHHVETVKNGQLTSNCGRDFRFIAGTTLNYAPTPSSQFWTCAVCQVRRLVAADAK